MRIAFASLRSEMTTRRPRPLAATNVRTLICVPMDTTRGAFTRIRVLRSARASRKKTAARYVFNGNRRRSRWSPFPTMRAGHQLASFDLRNSARNTEPQDTGRVGRRANWEVARPRNTMCWTRRSSVKKLPSRRVTTDKRLPRLLHSFESTETTRWIPPAPRLSQTNTSSDGLLDRSEIAPNSASPLGYSTIHRGSCNELHRTRGTRSLP